jgi:hypothetical protein
MRRAGHSLSVCIGGRHTPGIRWLILRLARREQGSRALHYQDRPTLQPAASLTNRFGPLPNEVLAKAFERSHCCALGLTFLRQTCTAGCCAHHVARVG